MRAGWLFGFRARLFTLVLLALVPMLGLTAYGAYEQRQAAVAAAEEEEALRIVERIDRAQRRVIEAGHALLFGLAQAPAVQRLEAVGCSDLLAEARRRFPTHESIGVTGPDGALRLPDLPGREVLARLRADPGTRDIPVAILSADATPGQVKRLLTEGAHAYLTKPFDVDRLLAVLDEYLATDARDGRDTP